MTSSNPPQPDITRTIEEIVEAVCLTEIGYRTSTSKGLLKGISRDEAVHKLVTLVQEARNCHPLRRIMNSKGDVMGAKYPHLEHAKLIFRDYTPNMYSTDSQVLYAMLGLFIDILDNSKPTKGVRRGDTSPPTTNHE